MMPSSDANVEAMSFLMEKLLQCGWLCAYTLTSAAAGVRPRLLANDQ